VEMEAGMGSSQARTAGVLWVEELSRTRCRG
jgi:hypothetical protein